METFAVIGITVPVIVWLVMELRGVIDKKKGDTQTEIIDWIDEKLPDIWAIGKVFQWFFRVFILGGLVWTILHFWEVFMEN